MPARRRSLSHGFGRRRNASAGLAGLAGLVLLLAGTNTASAADSAWSRQTTPAPGPARAIGGYTLGCLSGGDALPLDGPGYVVLRPQRLRYFGHPALIAVTRDLGARAAAEAWGTLLVGDLSQPRGGPMSYDHASHEIGLDVDIWLRLLPPGQRLDAAERHNPTPVSMVRPGTMIVDPALWTPRHAALARAAARDSRVARLFVNPAIKAALCASHPPDRDGNAAWLRKVRPWYGHDSHLHIRLHCPADSPECAPQDPPPPGAGCEAAVFEWWAHRLAPTPEVAAGDTPAPSPPPPPPPLPAACDTVLSAR